MGNLARILPGTRLVTLGNIKIGGKGAERTSRSGSTFRIPEKHNYFTVTTLLRNPAGDLIEDAPLMKSLVDCYGDPDDRRLRVLPIAALSNDPDDFLQAAYVWYGGKTVGARSDGETVTWFCDPKTGKRLDHPRIEPWNPEYLDMTNGDATNPVKLFKTHTQLSCSIASENARWGGVYKFRTTSVITGSQLLSSFTLLRQLTGGILMGLPLMLIVRPCQVAPNGKATTVYVVHVELHGPDLRALQEQARQQALWQLENHKLIADSARQIKLLLPPPGHESPADAADINEEFHPETAGERAPRHQPDANGTAFWKDIAAGRQPGEGQDEAATAEAQPDPAPVAEADTSPKCRTADKLALIADVQAYLDELDHAEALPAANLIAAAALDILHRNTIKTMAEIGEVRLAILSDKYCVEDGKPFPPNLGAGAEPDSEPLDGELMPEADGNPEQS